MFALFVVGVLFFGLMMVFGVIATAIGLPTELALVLGAIGAIAFLYNALKK